MSHISGKSRYLNYLSIDLRVVKRNAAGLKSLLEWEMVSVDGQVFPIHLRKEVTKCFKGS